MRKYTFNFYASVSMLAVAAVALVAFGFQQAQAAFKTGVAQGESIRVSEANSCSTAEDGDAPHFSGCNSIL